MSEFDLIEEILQTLGDSAISEQVRIGPGDDAAVVAAPAGEELVASIDTLVGGVHFPEQADPQLVGYRALMVAVSDLAAMGAAPGYALVALTLPDADVHWVRGVAGGLRSASKDCAVPIVGGNLTAGSVCISISVHGWIPSGGALTRVGACPGDQIYVTGPLGGAAAALARGGLAGYHEDELDLLARRYFKPQPRLAVGQALRGFATSAIDVSDGLLKDLDHICVASDVGADLVLTEIPVCPGATIEHALSGGDDYELCFTQGSLVGGTPSGVVRIGQVVEAPGLRIDGNPVNASGYEHFAS